MLIDFDPAKDKRNRAWHRLSLSVAGKLIWDEALVWVDSRYEYDEIRMVGLVPEGNTLYYVAFVDRNEFRRVISLRYAERKEIKHYAKNDPKARHSHDFRARECKNSRCSQGRSGSAALDQEATGRHGAVKLRPWAAKAREQETADVRAVQPGSHRVLPQHRRRVAMADGRRVECVCQQAGVKGLKANVLCPRLRQPGGIE